MKRLVFTITVILFSSWGFTQGNNGNSSNGQGTTKWNLNGNNASSNDFLGTNNNQSLIFKSNSQEVLKLTPNNEIRAVGDFYLEQEIDSMAQVTRYLTIGANGKVISTEKSGLLGAIYGSSCGVFGDNGSGTSYESPIWQSIPFSQQYGFLVTGIDCPARVGIGTATPDYQIHVVGNGYIVGTLGVGANPSSAVQINSFTNRKVGMSIDHNYAFGNGYVYKGTLYDITTRGLAILNGNSSNHVFQIFGDGRTIVGASTNSNSMLEIKNNSYANGINISHSNSSPQNSAINIDLETSDGYAIRINNSASVSDVFRVYNDGKVWATEINVALSTDFPDYVFGTDYYLMSFDELREYIKTNQHLPNIEPASYYEENGINTSELHIKEIEKIEELTRYILILEERIAELESTRE